jgi:hypothetical protein
MTEQRHAVPHERSIRYEVCLGTHRGMEILGPRPLSGPNNAELRIVNEAMEDIDRIARKVGLRLQAVVLTKLVTP